MLNPFKEGREKELKVGSHVILNHETKPYTWNGSNIHGNSINYAMRDKMIVTELDFHDAVINDGLRIDPVHLIVVSNPDEEGKISDFKVGDRVELNERTKPYTSYDGRNSHIQENCELEVVKLLNNDLLTVVEKNCGRQRVINKRHLNKLSEIEFKIGDEVVLRPETKPYTLKNTKGIPVSKQAELNDYLVYKVEKFFHDGDIYISGDNFGRNCISPHHLKQAKKDTNIGTLSVDLELNELLKDIDIVELRLAIFNGDTSRTLEEMQAIEKWLLNK